MGAADEHLGLAQAERAREEQGPAAALAVLRARPVAPGRPLAPAWNTLVAELLIELGRREEAREAGTLAVSAARANESDDGLAPALSSLGWALVLAGDPNGGRPLLQRAYSLAQQVGDRACEAMAMARLASLEPPIGSDAHHPLAQAVQVAPEGRTRTLLQIHLANSQLQAGQVEEAQLLLDGVLAGLTQESSLRARATAASAVASLRRGDLEGAMTRILGALSLLDGRDDPLVMETRGLHGLILRGAGDLDGADAAYRGALAGSSDDRPMRRNIEIQLAQTLLDRERWDEAARVLDTTMADAARDRLPRYEGIAAALRSAAAAATGDGPTWARCTARTSTLFRGAMRSPAEACLALRFAGEMWARSSDPSDLARAMRAHTLALALWQELDSPEQVAAEVAAVAALTERGAQLPAGPFDLVARLGTGAMGEVWRARHHVRGTEVAVKLLRTDATQDDLLRGGIDAEVRAVAALDHPGIVRLLGHGVLDAGEHRGSPWFAMEIVRGGTLHGTEGNLTWKSCRGVLAGLLDALAHAHARGVLHLDLKPPNVLLDSASDDGPRPRLTDFGVAGILASLAGSRRTVGTPRYMAPEQFRGHLRDLGPWTDLYALGCVAVHLVSGRPPYPGSDPSALRAAHLGAPIPKIVARIPLPVGFAEWIQRLLAKDPADRFQRAADAAWALSGLEDPEEGSVILPRRLETPVPEGAPPTFSLPSWDDLDASEIVTPSASRPSRSELPPMPTRWRGPKARRPPGLQALDLFGLRRVPFVGRERERSILWATLADVHRNGRPRVVPLEGPPGSGRSALARWLLETADERGVAQVFSVPCPRSGGGLRTLVADALRCRDLQPDALAVRISQRSPAGLQPSDQAALARLLADPSVGLDEVLGPAARLMEAMGEDRPVLVVLEEAPLADPAVAALLHELASGAGRILCVVEVTPAGHGRGADRRYDDLLDLPPVMPLQLEAPRREDIQAVVLELLPLEPDLVSQVVARSSGDLNLAVALVEDLVDRDALISKSSGLGLRDDASLELPARLEQAWSERLERALAGAEPALRDALCVCALAGSAVGPDTWKAVCDAVGLTAPSTAMRHLRTARLVVPGGDRSWAFAHPAIPEVLHEQGVVAGRLAELSELAARLFDFDDPGRLGRVRLDAGDLEGAVQPLLEGAHAASARGDARATEDLLHRRDEALRALGVPEHDARWRPGLELRVQLATQQSDVGPARQWVDRLVALAQSSGARADLSLALRLRAQVEEIEGDAAASVRSLDGALQAAREARDTVAGAHAHKLLGDAARRRGDLEGAMRHYRKGLGALEGSERTDDALAAALEAGVGIVYLHGGHLGPATVALSGAFEKLEAAGSWSEAARCAAALGSVACRRQDIAEAERWFDSATRLTPHAHRVRRASIRLDRCMLQVVSQDWTTLEREARSALGQVEDVPVLRAWARALLLPVHVVAPAGEWEAHVATLEADLRAAVLSTPDVARVAEAAAERAEGLGRPDRARVCWRIATAQWRTLGARADAARTRERGRGASP